MDLSNLVGVTGIPALVYYAGLISIAIFLAGFYVSKKIKGLCEETNSERDKLMGELAKRVEALEDTAIRKDVYKEGMDNVCELIREVKSDMKENFTSLSKRIDTLLWNKSNV